MTDKADTYLLYETMKKIVFTFRIKYRLDQAIDGKLLNEVAQKAFLRFPYFRVKLAVDKDQSYIFLPNDQSLAVFPEKDRKVTLGSHETNGHFFFISYRGDEVWFSASHAFCGSFGLLFWIKTTLYLYMCKKYGPLQAPEDLKLPDQEVSPEEIFYPDAFSLPDTEPLSRYPGGDCNIAVPQTLKYLLNPFAKNEYYYEIDIPSNAFMDYAKKIDGSPNTILCAMMYKVMTRLFKKREEGQLSGRIAADYRDDINASQSYRDFVRLIHVKYDWNMQDESITRLNMRARGAIIAQSQAENSWEHFRKIAENHALIDKEPTLKEKRRCAATHSTYRNEPRDPYTISYVGQVDYGDMESHIRGVYTLCDGNLVVEVNALKDSFHLSYQLCNKDKKPLELFLQVLKEENIPYTVSERKTKYLPALNLPEE